MNADIRDEDHGYAALLAKVVKMALRGKAGRQGGGVKVGVPDTPHEPSGEPVDELAQRHEFGIGVPQRSFLRAWVDEHRPEIELKMREFGYLELAHDAPDWRIPFGQWAVDRIRERIWAHIPPALNPETVQRKGASVPLIDSGQLVNAIIDEMETP